MARIRIEGERLAEVTGFRESGWGNLVYADLDDGTEWVLAEDAETAGEAAREYWKDMAENDPRELTCIVGEETLVQWGLGRVAGPGSTMVSSLEEWLDLWLDVPEEQWASYDGHEKAVDRVGTLCRDLGFTPTVAYRHN